MYACIYNILFVLQILYKITVDHGEVTLLTITPTPVHDLTHHTWRYIYTSTSIQMKRLK